MPVSSRTFVSTGDLPYTIYILSVELPRSTSVKHSVVMEYRINTSPVLSELQAFRLSLESTGTRIVHSVQGYTIADRR